MSSVRRCIHMKILFPLNVIHRFLAFALRRETGSGWSGLVHQSGKSFLSSPWRTFKAQRRCIAISSMPWRALQTEQGPRLLGSSFAQRDRDAKALSLSQVYLSAMTLFYVFQRRRSGSHTVECGWESGAFLRTKGWDRQSWRWPVLPVYRFGKALDSWIPVMVKRSSDLNLWGIELLEHESLWLMIYLVNLRRSWLYYHVPDKISTRSVFSAALSNGVCAIVSHAALPFACNGWLSLSSVFLFQHQVK